MHALWAVETGDGADGALRCQLLTLAVSCSSITQSMPFSMSQIAKDTQDIANWFSVLVAFVVPCVLAVGFVSILYMRYHGQDEDVRLHGQIANMCNWLACILRLSTHGRAGNQAAMHQYAAACLL